MNCPKHPEGSKSPTGNTRGIDVKIKFDEVVIKATKRWKENGKWRQKTKKFHQTINPFNTDENGNPKTRGQIMCDLLKERDEWLANREHKGY